MSNYQRNQSGLTPNTEAGGRRVQLASRNASTYNPISFNPESQTNLEDNDKIQKKNKQAAYRDQLDQMVSNNRNPRNVPDEHMQVAQREAAYAPEMERREAEQRYPEQNDNQRRSDEEAYLQEQYKKMAEYERYQQQMDQMEKNYKVGKTNQNIDEDYSRPIQETRQPQIQQPEVNRAPQKNQEAESTFNQQDNQRELLLNKIKSGYNQQNNYVLNSYQRAHDEKERNKQDFERNIINKAVQDRQREEVRAMSDWDRKKRMQQEAADANRRAAESRMLEKKRTKMEDTLTENQRNQDSLSQFEKEGYRQKENQKRLREEASRVLEQQIRESSQRKVNKEENVTLFSHPLKNNADYQRNYYEKEQQSPLQPSNNKINQAPTGGKQYEALDKLSSQMDQLSMKANANYPRDEDYGQGYSQNQYQQQYGGYLANQNDYQEAQNKQYSQQQQQQYQYSGDLGAQNNYQEAQTRPNLAYLSEYQKNRLRNRNAGYNIISNNNG